MKIITGYAAIEYAKQHGVPLQKYADPIEEARSVTHEEALEIAREDQSLIWVETKASGQWHDAEY